MLDIAFITIFPDSSNIAIVVEFIPNRDGRVEVKFYREGNRSSSQYTELIGFNNPVKAIRSIFRNINMIRGLYPEIEFYYTATDKKRENLYRKLWKD